MYIYRRSFGSAVSKCSAGSVLAALCRRLGPRPSSGRHCLGHRLDHTSCRFACYCEMGDIAFLGGRYTLQLSGDLFGLTFLFYFTRR